MPTLTSLRRALLSAPLFLIVATLVSAGFLAAQEFVPPSAEQRLEALGSLEGETFTTQRLLTPDDDFAPIEAPEPPDWLFMHEEPGQTYGGFILTDVQRVSEQRRVIYLQPLGEFPADSAPSLDALREYAAAFFQLEVVLLPAELFESAAFQPRLNSSTKKPQLLSTAILTWLARQLPDDAFCLIAVTMSDLYPAPDWNFVYGQASSLHRTGVFSFARHDPLFFSESRPDDFDALMLRRSCKTLVHEIAHIFGLAHCIYYRCVENGVNHPAESDSRPHHLCPICLRKLRYATGADLETRYRDLAYFYSQHIGWEDEEAWVRRQLAKLRAPEYVPPRMRTVPPDLDRTRAPAPILPAPPAGPSGEPRTQPALPVLPKLPASPEILPPPAPAPQSAPPPDAATPPVPTPMASTEPLIAATQPAPTHGAVD